MSHFLSSKVHLVYFGLCWEPTTFHVFHIMHQRYVPLVVTKYIERALRIHACNRKEGVGPAHHIITNQAARIHILKHGHSGLHLQHLSKLHFQVVQYPSIFQALLTYTKEGIGGGLQRSFQLWHQIQQTSTDHSSS